MDGLRVSMSSWILSLHITDQQHLQMNKKSTIIPAGYRVVTQSWENDGDHPRTIVCQKLSKREAELLVRLATLLQARGTGLENEYGPSDEVREEAYERLIPIFEDFTDIISVKTLAAYQLDGSHMLDYIVDKLLGYSVEDYGLRVLESFEVEWVPIEIVIENVTEQFTK